MTVTAEMRGVQPQDHAERPKGGSLRQGGRLHTASVFTAASALVLLFLLCAPFCGSSHAAESRFDAAGAVKEEARNLAAEGAAFVKAPVTRYLPATAATLGAFALTYVYDRDIRSKLLSSKSGALDDAADAGSLLGNPLLHLGGAAVVYGAGVVTDAPGMVRLGQEMGEALILADACTYFLKTAVGRARPATGDDKGRFRPFRLKTDYDSLPSLHATSSFALAHVLASETESFAAKVLCYGAAGFVGFSRMYQQKHWASDIVISAALGELAGRVVTGYHRREKSTALRLVPGVSPEGAPLLALQGTFR